MSEHILVIKLSALGDFVQALGPFQAIRRRHPDAEITLVTTRPFKELAEKSGYFDRVIADGRAQLREIKRIWRLRRFLVKGRFDMVYDLQTSDRTSMYYHLMWPHKPNWSGIAKGCSHPHTNPDRNRMHTIERQAEQLAMAGIPDVPPPDVSWMNADLGRFNLPDRYALLIPGGAPHRPDKRWPAEKYGELARRLHDGHGLTPVVLGTQAEEAEAAAIQSACPATISLLNQTSLFEIASIARMATCAIGNDTGPMHIAAIAGAPSLVLYSHASDPALCGQRGKKVDILRVADLDALDVGEVESRLAGLLPLAA
ncbi:glycosyltransferase family 9 protein [Aestuariispira ectoiniformans]|uniref:glycosyltransferase family 9 protein n=1 Tax=Aestuariispira ectoiniformans TaxID=2775080 RepID=UPI00223B4355|nr:glycosyltransferase family 9 protein [Aestuariispira ectoiniformans]